MATLTLSESFDGIWPPDAMAGGVITLRQGIRMTYTSAEGFTVTLRGTDLTYDDDGIPSGGTVTGILVVKDGVTFANMVGMTTDFGWAGMQLLGFDRNDGRHQDPDPYNLMRNALRGDDLITGSDGWDDIRSGSGNDTINAGADGDYVGDEAGDDVMDGGDGWDTLSFDEAGYSWSAYRGVLLDAVTGTAIDSWGGTNTFVNFERFKDTQFSDTLKGSDAEEQFVINRGNDSVDGRGGFDRVDYSEADRWGAHRGINVNLTTGIAIDSWKGTDTLTGIEGIRGTMFNDTVIGSARDESFGGGRGLDNLNGGGGEDWLEFWDVGDHNDNGHGITVNLGANKEVTDDGYGNTENADNFENIGGGLLNDKLTGSTGSNRIDGNDGNDTISGGGGEDFLDGGWGNDVISGGVGNNDHISGGGGNDRLTGDGGNDNFNFVWDLANSGVDTITDFAHGADRIYVASWWGGGFTVEDLVATQFRSGAGVTTANSATQRVIYNTTTGDLYFDIDGVGGVAAVRFAVLSNHAALTFDDIHIQF